MRLNGLRIGFAMTGSHCTVASALKAGKILRDEGAQLLPVISPAMFKTDTRFGKADDLYNEVFDLAGREPVTTISEAEPIGPEKLCDVMVISPCTGNTLAKLCGGVTDTCVLMAAKAHLRNLRPVVLAVATNDGLGINAKNIGILLNTKNIFFVPFGQDNWCSKPNSLMADLNMLTDTIEKALCNLQLQPLLITYDK